MAPPPQVVQWLERAYPKPQVDPEWLEACYTWIIDEYHLNPTSDLEKIMQHIEAQLLQSDLEDSMVAGTGLPTNVSELDNTWLRGPPVLVEITAMTEIGHSAISLQNTREIRLDSSDLIGLTAENANEEEDGPIPNYPRSMMRFELSDGSTTFQAMEYRTLPELQLGVTPLGYKMLLKGVFIRRGIGFLEPKSVTMKGYQTGDRAAVQDQDFARSLRMRLGQPEPDPEDEPPAPPEPSSFANPRSPLREISEPPRSSATQNARTRYDDDENEPRRRRIPDPTPSSSSSTLVGSAYFSTNSSSSSGTRGTNPDRSTMLTRERLLSPARTTFQNAEAGPSSNPKDNLQDKKKELRAQSSSDFGDDDMVMDDDFLEQIAQAEKEAIMQDSLRGNASGPSSISGSGSGPVASTTSNTTSGAGPQVNVITIEEDSEDDKENVPLPTRNVRRRVIEQNVIDISDSD